MADQPLLDSPRRCSHGAEVHIGCTDPWPGISDRGEEAVRFIFDACHYFGASLVTAHRVCAVVAEECERIEAERG
jgi:hypothetical protein